MILIKILKNIKNNTLQTKKSINPQIINQSLKSLNFVKKQNKLKKIHKIKNLTCLKRIKQNPINYVLTLNISQTNTLINLSSPDGKPLISLSGGSINLKKRQKKLQPLALINLLKSLILIANFTKDKYIAIHFKNVKSYYESLVIDLLKKVILIKSIKSSNLQPHNGCRPKKLKKFKRRTKKS